jgi:hypothetical protein
MAGDLSKLLPLGTEVLGHTVRVIDREGNDVAGLGDITPESRALADLFAASHDMAEALDSLSLMADAMEMPDMVKIAQDALRKARWVRDEGAET